MQINGNAMSGSEHYQRAEHLLTRADGQDPEHATYTVAKAQVHAMLAQAAPTTRPALARDADALAVAFIGAMLAADNIRIKSEDDGTYNAEAWNGLTCMSAKAATPHEALTEATDLLAGYLADDES